MTPSELVAVKRTALNAVETLKVAGYAGTGEQLRGAIEMLVGELESREELPAPCRTCGGFGLVAEKRGLEDGWGEVDVCPSCANNS